MALHSAGSESSLEYVGFWPRFGAQLIDMVLLLVVTTPPLVLIYGWGYFFEEGPLVKGPADFLISFIFPAVATIMFWAHRQATPGKMAVAARIVDERTGRPASLGQLITRYLTYIISGLFLMLGFIWVAFDPKRQGWHDKFAGTVVIRPAVRGPAPVRFDRR